MGHVGKFTIKRWRAGRHSILKCIFKTNSQQESSIHDLNMDVFIKISGHDKDSDTDYAIHAM